MSKRKSAGHGACAAGLIWRKRPGLGVDHGRIRLRGEVDWDSQRRSVEQLLHSRQERDAAQGAAWAVPGVRCVINEIDVGP